jgi:hypothetical protein
MHLRARIEIHNGLYSEWEAFFQSYQEQRWRFVENETITRLSDNEAEVTFDVRDIEGLTELSASSEIREKETQLGIVTTLL